MKSSLRQAGTVLLFCALAAPASAAPWQGEPTDRSTRSTRGGCIGGRECRKNGDQLRIRLDGDAVSLIRFRARDGFGKYSNGRLRIRIDGETIVRDMEVSNSGRLYELDVSGLRGRELVFETLTRDDVRIEDIDVVYGRGKPSIQENIGGIIFGGGPSRGDDRGSSWDRHQDPYAGGCFGTEACRRSGSEWRVPLERRPVGTVRFNARREGRSGDVRLRVLIDGRTIERELRVSERGRSYEIDAGGLSGAEVVFEVVSSGDVLIEDIRVDYGSAKKRRPW
jgi:hypothetical protein